MIVIFGIICQCYHQFRLLLQSFHLFRLHKEDKISFQTLKVKFALLTGKKIAKFSFIAVLMMIPVVNVIVGAGLLFNLLYGVGTLANKYVPQQRI